MFLHKNKIFCIENGKRIRKITRFLRNGLHATSRSHINKLRLTVIKKHSTFTRSGLPLADS